MMMPGTILSAAAARTVHPRSSRHQTECSTAAIISANAQELSRSVELVNYGTETKNICIS